MEIPARPEPQACDAPAKFGPCQNRRKVIEFEPVGLRRVDQVRVWQLAACGLHLTGPDRALVELLGEYTTLRGKYLDRGARLRAVTEDHEALKMSVEIGSQLDRAVQRSRQPACWHWPDDDQRPAMPSRDAEGLRVWHDGCCAICGKQTLLVLDHDHWSGLIRGWLCHQCNWLEGGEWARDGATGMYRQRHPALMFRIVVLYTEALRERRRRRQKPS